MSESRFAGRVGLFVAMGIILIAALMLNFSRGIGLFKGKYELIMHTRTVAGLKPRSAVYLSGIQVGNVQSVQLNNKNKDVLVHLRILKDFPIHNDARFVIEQIGVLGDQFVIIYPGSAEAPLLKDGDEVVGSEPFNFQDLARSTTDLLKRFEQLGTVVGDAIQRVNTQLLDKETLGNLSQTISNFRHVSERTMGVVDGLGTLVTNNTPALGHSMSNLVAFTERMHSLAGELDQTVAANRSGLNNSLNNLQDSTAALKKLTGDLEAGRGVAGGLLKDERMKTQLSEVVSNLSILSSNLNRYGLLYKPKQPKNTNPPAYSGRNPLR